MSSATTAMKIFSDRSELISLVHDTITPAEIRQGEKISAKIQHKIMNEVKVEETRVWRMSPIGIEIVATDRLKNFKIGEVIELEVQVGHQVSVVTGQRVTQEYEENGLPLIGIRFCSRDNEEWQGTERRANKRWNCSAEFMPNGVAPNPGRFNDYVYFRVADLSSNGMRIVTSLRNKFLIPGMILDASMSFPLVGQTLIKIQLKNTQLQNEAGRDVLVIGVEFIEKEKIARDIIGQYIFQFGPQTSLKELQKENLPVSKTNRAVDFRFVRTADEYNEVLELRKMSYLSSGKLKEDATVDDVADIYDSRARIVIGLYRGQVVASARLVFNELDDKMEHEEFVDFPSEFPRRDEICEITRICTHNDFRGSSLLLDLFRYVGLTVVQSKRKYILGCATDELLPLYKNIGFGITKISYEYASLNNIKHTIFIGDVLRGLTGEGISPIYWNIVWGELYDYLDDHSYVSANPVAALRVAFYKLFGPISFYLHRTKKKKTKK